MNTHAFWMILGLTAAFWLTSCQSEKANSRSRPGDGLEETDSYISTNQANAESTTSTTDGDSSVVIGAGTIGEDFTVKIRRISGTDAAAILGAEVVSGVVGVEVRVGGGPLGDALLNPEALGKTFELSQVVMSDNPARFSALVVVLGIDGQSTTYRIPADEITRQSLGDGRWKLTARVRATRLNVFFGDFEGVIDLANIPIADASRRVRIERFGLTGDTAVVRGANLDLAESLTLSGSGPFRIVSKTSTEMVVAASAALRLAIGSVAEMLVSTAYGDTTTVPVAIESFTLTGNTSSDFVATVSNQHNLGSSFYRSSAANGNVRAAFGSDTNQSFVVSESAHPLVLSTNGAVRMFIDSDGEIGIGTKTPSGALHVTQTTAGDGYTLGRFTLFLNPAETKNQTYVGLAPTVKHTSTGAVAAMFGTFSQSHNESTATVTQSFGAFNRSANLSSGTVDYAIGSVLTSWNNANGTITHAFGSLSEVFNSASGTIADAVAGNFAISNTGSGTITSAIGAQFTVARTSGNITNAYGAYIGIINGTNKWSLYADDETAKSFFAGRVEIGMELAAGNVSGDALQVGGDVNLAAGKCVKIDGTQQVGTCSSDQRLKKGIRPIAGALDRITQLTPVNYRFRTEDFPERNLPEQEQQGLIAQDVERVYPDLVSQDADGYKRVKYGNELMMQSIAAIKELRGELARKDQTIEQLKALVCLDHPKAAVCQK